MSIPAEAIRVRLVPVLRKGHYMSAMPFLDGARYITCAVPGCGKVKRNDFVWPAMKPLIHNGRKP